MVPDCNQFITADEKKAEDKTQLRLHGEAIPGATLEARLVSLWVG